MWVVSSRIHIIHQMGRIRGKSAESPKAFETLSSSSCSSFSSMPSGSSLVSATIALRNNFFSARLTIPTGGRGGEGRETRMG